MTKTAAEDLCELLHRRHGSPCIVLRTSRFFPEVDDDASRSRAYADANVKANEYLHRRVELQDVVDAHMLALEKAPSIGFGAVHHQRHDALPARRPARRCASTRRESSSGAFRSTRMNMRAAVGGCSRSIERVYVNERARRELGWRPRYDFRHIVDCLRTGDAPWSPLARAVGAKGYHDRAFADGPYPVS